LWCVPDDDTFAISDSARKYRDGLALDATQGRHHSQ
jgi:hypothetical protein